MIHIPVSSLRKRCLLLLGTLWLSLIGFATCAAPIDEATALRVARNYVSQHLALHGTWNGALQPEVRNVELISHEGSPIGYLVAAKPSGYVLVSYDDDLVPVIVYSPEGTFDAVNVAQFGSLESWIMPELSVRLQTTTSLRKELMQTANEEAIARLRDESPAARAWLFFNRVPELFRPLQNGGNEKIAGLDGATIKAGKLGPLLSTTWGQGEDRAPYTYNLYTPAGSGCTHTLTGCVATAATQIMKYWNWPDRGTGSSSYTWSGQPLSANYDFAYNWTSMPNQLSGASAPAAIDAVARLMQHVGIAFRMNFGCGAAGGSGAYTSDVATVFPQYFKYRTGIRTVTRSAMTAAAFFQNIRAELDASPARPVLFSMRTSSGGHAVVIDGYQAGVTNLVQVNMGWGGYANAFYDISNDWSAGGLNWIASTQVAYTNIQPTSSASCSYALGSSGTTQGPNGGSGSVLLTAGSACAFTVANSTTWISVAPLAGSGTTNILYTVAPNTGSGARTGSLTIGGQIFSVTQTGGSCAYNISSASQSFASGAGTASLSLTTGSTCAWSIAPNGSWAGTDAWITFLTPTSGTGSASISYSVAPNLAAGSRTSTLSISGQSHTVTQSGSCGYAIYPSTQTMGAASASGSFRLETGSTCAWTAASGVAWLSVAAPTSGSGSATLAYTAAANNTGAARSGSVTVGRQVFTVNQAAAGTAPTGIANGDFEQGRAVWVEQGSQILYNDPARSHTGYWMAWLGGYDNGTDILHQTFTVPSNATSVSLRGWYAIFTTETAGNTAYDVITVDVYNSTGTTKLATLGALSNLNAVSTWTQSPAYDMSAFRGQTIRLVFSATTDASLPTSFYIDDVTLVAVGSSCTYAVSPQSQSIGSTMSMMSFVVTTNPTTGCNWNASTNASWLAVSGAASGTGSAEVRISASENTSGSARNGTATIAGQSVSISQSAPALDSAIVKNGEFESGSDYWQEASSAGYGIISASTSLAARTGVGYAWLGGYNSAIESLTQLVNIPGSATSAVLSFWFQVRTEEVAGQSIDLLSADLLDAATGQVLMNVGRLSNLDRNTVWTKSADVDITSLKGRAVKLVFRATTDTARVTSFFIDSVKVTVSGGTPGIASPLLKNGGIDIDGDGRGEVVVRSPSSSMLAGRWVNNQISWTAMTDPGPNYKVLAAVDLDSQGRSDLVMLNVAQGDLGEARIWSAFNPGLPKTLRNVRTLWRVDAVGDLDGDGKGDLVWRFTGATANIDDTGVSYIWFTNGSGVTQVRKRGGAPLSWTLLGARDLNGDGAADMVYVSPNKQVRVLMATPNRTCANLSGGALPSADTPFALGSFSGVGKGEIMSRDVNSGFVQFIALDAQGLQLPAYTGAPDDPNASCTSSSLTIPSTVTRVANAADPFWQFIAAVDLNGDGITDVVWRRTNDTALIVWIMAAGGQVGAVYNNAGTLPLEYTPIQR